VQKDDSGAAGARAGDEAWRPGHAATVESWRQARAERLLAPTGWLALIDRIFLAEGENETPIGLVPVAGGRAFLRARTDVEVTVGGAPAGERELHTEDQGALDRVVAGGIIYELSSIAGELSLRVKDPQSVARQQFRGLSFFPIDPGWRVPARFEPAAAGAPGRAHFSAGGQALSLTTESAGGGRLVFVFADETNRGETYPGGRFLYADAPVGGEVVLDFNFAFNPPCAFTAHSICPAVPPENRLPLRVAAGERRYDGP
jgi:uncharacterized protein